MIASYYYDPFGRRLWKEVGGLRAYFFYADEGLVGEYDESGNEIKTYGYKPGSTWTTDPLFLKENGQYYFYHTDHLGAPQKLSGINGAVVWCAEYSSFGQSTVDASSCVTNNLRFPGQYYDEETGLHYNYHRYYDPVTGRYLRNDPIGFAGGINLFSYILNNPINFIDPTGLDPVDDVGLKEFYDLIKDIKDAAEKAKEDDCNPCMSVISTNRAACQCVFNNKYDFKAMIECLCWNSLSKKRCEEKANEMLKNIFSDKKE